MTNFPLDTPPADAQYAAALALVTEEDLRRARMAMAHASLDSPPTPPLRDDVLRAALAYQSVVAADRRTQYIIREVLLRSCCKAPIICADACHGSDADDLMARAAPHFVDLIRGLP